MLRRWTAWVVVIGLAIVLACLAYRLWRIWQSAQPLLQHMDTMQALAADPTTLDPTAIGPMVQEVHTELVTLRDEAAPILTLSSHLGWVPGFGPDLQALPVLLDVTVELTGAGEVAVTGLSPLVDMMGAGAAVEGTDSLSLAVHGLAEARPHLEAAQERVRRAAQLRAEVDTAELSPRLVRLVSLLDRALPLAQAGVEGALIVPDLLGASGPRTYLLMAQNSDELRPTGGFITGAGQLTLDEGDIVEFSFRDSYFADDFSKPYDEPPAPLHEYMLSDLWVFRDANWSPDFPTSARKAAELYTYGQGGELDGVIAFDQYGVAGLVEALGPFTAPGWSEPVTGDNLVRLTRQAWATPEEGVSDEWALTRKSFMGDLAQAMLERIRQDPGSVDWPGLGQALWQILQERHLLIYLEEPTAAMWLRRQGWDGALRMPEGDYLMIVDANLGFNKVNPRVERALAYQVMLQANGSAEAMLAVNYQHSGQGNASPCNHRATFGQGERLTYETLMEGCYWNYLRVYAPEGSLLQAASRHPTPAEYLLRGVAAGGEIEVLPEELGKSVFGQFFVLEYGQALVTHFEYSVPNVARLEGEKWHYALLIQKQPGTGSTPVSVVVVLPPGSQLLEATPLPHARDGETLVFNLSLEADASVEVIYGHE